VELRLERLGAEMEFATVVTWLKAEGDPVAAGEPIAEVEVEKITQELTSPVDGVLREIVAVVGDEIPVDALVAVIEERAT
jgi:pyruvate/2-oxoglutarate dehydrogenase complex dihydrolipoamide acyltransferase (E2) component